MQYIEKFLEITSAKRGIAGNSLVSHKSGLLNFQEFLLQSKIAELSVSPNDIDKYIITLASRQISPPFD